eukprot:CAMPEP_0179022080 /NCGR_PEP_ID=MMETSP0796-20121207/6221_1 /TAXON_ID=73915 /ORGANISM="Pyrodinium bahamense, Strain pbaha01" /LENGTH=59 /DNA_ID=CAMNT_0020717931 /DNA_START=353 /DNA_END=532 /DNA_ORIENTATION=+
MSNSSSTKVASPLGNSSVLGQPWSGCSDAGYLPPFGTQIVPLAQFNMPTSLTMAPSTKG